MDSEQLRAIKEGERIGASDAYFAARHDMLDARDRRNVFGAGFDRGYDAAVPVASVQSPLKVPKHVVDAVMAVVDPYLGGVRRYDVLCDQIYVSICAAMED